MPSLTAINPEPGTIQQRPMAENLMTDAEALAAPPYTAQLCATASQLYEIDDIRKVCDNGLTSTTDASRHHPSI